MDGDNFNPKQRLDFLRYVVENLRDDDNPSKERYLREIKWLEAQFPDLKDVALEKPLPENKINFSDHPLKEKQKANFQDSVFAHKKKRPPISKGDQEDAIKEYNEKMQKNRANKTFSAPAERVADGEIFSYKEEFLQILKKAEKLYPNLYWAEAVNLVRQQEGMDPLFVAKKWIDEQSKAASEKKMHTSSGDEKFGFEGDEDEKFGFDESAGALKIVDSSALQLDKSRDKYK